jgi:hypothetical protein
MRGGSGKNITGKSALFFFGSRPVHLPAEDVAPAERMADIPAGSAPISSCAGGHTEYRCRK